MEDVYISSTKFAGENGNSSRFAREFTAPIIGEMPEIV